MSCTANINRHIHLTPIGLMFTTRDCLKYGARSAVDKALKRCVDNGLIVRLTSGVFMRMDGKTPMPSALNLAKVKAKAFGKNLVEHGADLAHEQGFILKGNQQPTFHVNGGNSSFRYGAFRIRLRSSSNKRMQMKDTPTGQAVRALWHLGSDICGIQHVEKAVIRINRPDVRRELVLSKAWMPAWLAEFFPTEGYPCPLNAPAQNAYFRDYFNPDPRVEEAAGLWSYQADKLAAANLQNFPFSGS
jgi:hypothetical protein